MKPKIKTKQIVVRFDEHSYDIIRDCAERDHRSIGEFVRHTALLHVEYFDEMKKNVDEAEGISS